MNRSWIQRRSSWAKIEVLPVHVASRSCQQQQEKQTEIAELIGADQPKVSKIMNGKLDEFSIERITEYMQKLGYDWH